MRCPFTSSKKGLGGKIFTEFIALILILHLVRKVKELEIYNNYSMQQMLDKLDIIECF